MPDYSHAWRVEPAVYKLTKRRQHDLFGEAADIGRDELGWTDEQVAYARRYESCPRGVLFPFWWSLLEHLVAADKTRRAQQFADYMRTDQADEITDEVSSPAPARPGAG